MIFIKFRDLEGFTFRYFLTQFLPWFVAQDSAIECLTYVGYYSKGFPKIYFKTLDEITLSFNSGEDYMFGFYFTQWMSWFTYQMEFDWPTGEKK
jgi:hypothetical protein